MSVHDTQLKRLYQAGKNRKEAMIACGITNTNVMSSASSRLNLHWSWPLENRKSGKAPQKKTGSARPRNPVSHAMATEKVIVARRNSHTGKAPRQNMPAIDAPETIPTQRLYGKPTHLSSRQKRLRGLTEHEQSGAFPKPSEDLPADILKSLQQLYVS